jgi:PHP family Zn ribbon phosphoesterase
MKLTKEFGSELDVLLNVEEERLKLVVDQRLVDIIAKNREGKLKVQPGYDGVYGKLMLNGNISSKQPQKRIDGYI